MKKNYQPILDFWFAGSLLGIEQKARWWQKNSDVDNTIKQQFSGLIAEVHEGLYEHWSETPKGRLAAIICLDQFPRNAFRDSEKSFGFDDRALFLTVEGLNHQHEKALSPIEQAFFMMPLMHDETLDSQHRCVAFYEDIVRTTKGDVQAYLKGSLDFAVRHRDIIQQFGRFPHRNRLLGRQSTPEEKAFLERPDASF